MVRFLCNLLRARDVSGRAAVITRRSAAWTATPQPTRRATHGPRTTPAACRTGSTPTPRSTRASRSASSAARLELRRRSRPRSRIPATSCARFVGDTPVIVDARQRRRRSTCFVNRCAHRGVQFCQRAVRQRHGVHLPLPPVDLRPRRASCSACRSSKGVDGQRRHAGRLRPRRPRPRAARASRERHGVVFASFDPTPPPLEDYLGADDARLLRPRVRRPRAARARLLSASGSRRTGS